MKKDLRKSRIVSGIIMIVVGVLLISTVAVKFSLPLVVIGVIATAFGAFTVLRNVKGKSNKSSDSESLDF